jgi:plastocyanin
MTPARLGVAAALAAAALLAAGCGGGGGGTGSRYGGTTTAASGNASTGKALAGSVGPGFDISLTKDGQPVTSLAPGTYTLTVNDQADIHNFHLTGPGVDVSTGVGEKGTKTFTITVRKRSYHFQCDPHSSSMNGDFTAG